MLSRSMPALRADPSRGQIASYALGDDYHRMMRKALIELDGWLRAQVWTQQPWSGVCG